MSRMHPTAVERRCVIIRYMADHGGHVAGLRMEELAVEVGMTDDAFRNHVRRLEEFGVLEIERPLDFTKGRSPNVYRLKHTEKWFREHADALDAALRSRARKASLTVRKAEEERVLAARDRRAQSAPRAQEGAARVRRGLPGVPPPAGEPEPKSQPVSVALREALIEEGMKLPAEELARWGA